MLSDTFPQLLLLLLVCLPCCVHPQEVTADYNAPGFERALTDDDLSALYTANLEPDIGYWRESGQQRRRQFTVADLVEQAKRVFWSPYVAILVVKDGIVYRFRSDHMPDLAAARTLNLQAALMELHANGTHIPNTIIIFNAEDEPLCHRLQGCRVPIFTLFKRTAAAGSGQAAAASSGLGQQQQQQQAGEAESYMDEEVLLPNFGQDWGCLCFVPWASKNNSALLRASFQWPMTAASSRYQLTALSARSQEAAQVLDAGIVWSQNDDVAVPQQQMRPFIGLSKHAYWRFLLSTDGHTASSRLGHLLGVNSVVLKERSPWVEYYYRSLTEGKDHFGFDTSSVLDQIKQLQAPERSAEMQQVATAGQQFAYRYLHQRAKALYARQAIVQYNKLFKGLHSFVKQLPLRGREGEPGWQQPSLWDLMGTLSDLTAVAL